MTEKPKLPAEPERQQWVLDPHHPTGFRLVDLPDPPSQPVAFFDGEVFERQFDQGWPPQKGPPDPAPPIKICRLDETAPPEEPDPWRMSFPPFPEFSLRGRDQLTAYELIMVMANSDPYAPWWADARERAADRRELMNTLAAEVVINLQRDVCDGIIRPLVAGYDVIRGKLDPSSDVIDIDDANAFARRIGSDRWAALWAEREKKPSQQPADAPSSKKARRVDYVPANRRGPPPSLRLRIESQMIRNIKEGVITVEGLACLKQEALAEQYGAKSRSTAVQARDNVLKQLRQNNSDKLRQTPTTDK